MNIQLIITLLLVFLLSACNEIKNQELSVDKKISNKVSVDSNYLDSVYTEIKFPFKSDSLFINNNFIDLNKYEFSRNDLKLFYSGENEARILQTMKKKISGKEYLLALVVVNFNNYEGAGPAQVIFLSGGENRKKNYQNTIFIAMGGKFPIIDDEVKGFYAINEKKLKNYCIQNFILNADLSKMEKMKCVGDDPSSENRSFKFNIENLGYDEV